MSLHSSPLLPRPEAVEGTGRRSYRQLELLFLLLAVAIATVAYMLVGLGTTDSIPANVWQYAIWLAVLGLAMHAVIWWKAKYADPILMPVAVLLNGIGIAMIYRIDIPEETSVAQSQLTWMTLGTLLTIAVLFVIRDHRILSRYTYIFGLLALFLLILPMVPGLGAQINGARIWIRVGPFSFQPGELAKICLAIFFAGYLSSVRDQLVLAGNKVLGVPIPRLRDAGAILIAWCGAILILVSEKDLGTSLLFFGLFVCVLYAATGMKSWIFIGLGLFAIGATAAALFFDHVQQRISGWLHALDPAEYNKEYGGSYQLVQGLFGMAQGGLTGTGWGEGRPQIVPYANSDFIFASLGEELGTVGLFAILMLYVIIFERGIKTATKLRDGFGKLLAVGLSFSIVFQCFIVIGGVTRLIPLTGLTTPFLAAGGSSLVSNWIIIGLLLRMSDNARRPQEEFRTGALRIVADPEPKPATKRSASSRTVSGPAPEAASPSASSVALAEPPARQDPAAGKDLQPPAGAADHDDPVGDAQWASILGQESAADPGTDPDDASGTENPSPTDPTDPPRPSIRSRKRIRGEDE